MAENFYWAVQEFCNPELARCFHLDFHDNFVYVYCEGYGPGAVMKEVNHQFFARFGIRGSEWEVVFCLPWSRESWVAYDVRKHANFPGGKFGWRHREKIRMEENPSIASSSLPSGLANLVKIPRSDDDEIEAAPSSSPGVIRKIMD